MNNRKLVWLDMETGGLNGLQPDGSMGCESLPILEIAVIVTDFKLEEIGYPLRKVIFTGDEALEAMSEWSKKHHAESGLISEVRNSGTTLEEAEHGIIEHLKGLGLESAQYIEGQPRAENIGIMAGNSIAFDRSFVQAQMPELDVFLHHRMLDVSAVALFAETLREGLEADSTAHKQYAHTAVQDIRESIQQMRVLQKRLIPTVEIPIIGEAV